MKVEGARLLKKGGETVDELLWINEGGLFSLLGSWSSCVRVSDCCIEAKRRRGSKYISFIIIHPIHHHLRDVPVPNRGRKSDLECTIQMLRSAFNRIRRLMPLSEFSSDTLGIHFVTTDSPRLKVCPESMPFTKSNVPQILSHLYPSQIPSLLHNSQT